MQSTPVVWPITPFFGLRIGISNALFGIGLYPYDQIQDEEFESYNQQENRIGLRCCW